MDTILDNSITLDIESEEELVMRIEQQLENYYNEPIMIDYLDFYARRFVGVPDYEDISKLEDYIDTSEERNRYLEMIQMLKVRFIKYLGINCYNSTDEEIEFETLYAIYYTFVLNIDKVLSVSIGFLYLNSEAISHSTGILQLSSISLLPIMAACIAVPHPTI